MDNWKRIAPAHVPGRTRFQEVPKYEEGLYDLGNEVYACFPEQERGKYFISRRCRGT